MNEALNVLDCRKGVLTVLIADDDQAFRANLRSFLLFRKAVKIVGEVAEGGNVVNLARLLRPDLILMNISILKSVGPEIIRIIRTVSPQTEIAFTTVHDESIYRDLTELMHIDEFVSKQSLNTELPRILEKLQRMKGVVCDGGGQTEKIVDAS